jgi:hypothetical protein
VPFFNILTPIGTKFFQPLKTQLHSYLAVVAGLCSEADYIFIPEDPAKVDWPKRLCAQLSQARHEDIKNIITGSTEVNRRFNTVLKLN